MLSATDGEGQVFYSVFIPNSLRVSLKGLQLENINTMLVVKSRRKMYFNITPSLNSLF